jgi:tetratricopeptide (TPR) repeat protein
MAKNSKRKRARRRRGERDTERGTGRALVREVVEEARGRAAEAGDPATAPERVAAIVAEDFDGMPAPLGFVQLLVERDSPERARAVVERVAALAPGSVTALTFQAEAARVLDGDSDRAWELLDEALDAGWDVSAVVPLGWHLLEAGRVLEALECAGEQLLDDPFDSGAQELQARALAALHDRAQAGEEFDAGAHAALERFGDRRPIYRLRESLVRLVEGDRELLERQARTVREWLEGAVGEDGDLAFELTGSGGERLSAEREAIMRIAHG